MIKYITNNIWGFSVTRVDVQKISDLFQLDGYPNYIGCDGDTPEKLPVHLKVIHEDRYLRRYSQVYKNGEVLRPLLRLSTREEQYEDGWGPLFLLDGRHRIAVLRDLGLTEIEVEVPWRETLHIEALFL